MPNWIKKAFYTLLACFALYYVFTQPEETANVVKGFFTGIFRLFAALAK